MTTTPEAKKEKTKRARVGKATPVEGGKHCPACGDTVEAFERQTKRYTWVIVNCAKDGKVKYRTMKRAMGLPKPPKEEKEEEEAS